MRPITTLLLAASLAAAANGQMPDYVDALPLPVTNDAWIWAGSPPGDPSHLFVMDGGGNIRVLDIAHPPGELPVYTLRPAPFAAIPTNQARSIAFAPDYPVSGKLYVAHEIGSGDSRITELTRSAADPYAADPGAKRTIRDFTDLSFDHALGSIHFGRDGMLYIGAGDGHTSGNAQLITNVKGKMLRIDVRSGIDDFPDDPARNYRVPPDNPLVARPAASPEIWHIGLRNPWRWSFDRWSGDMWICDVGGGRAGEIDRLPLGTPAYRNLGWPCFDGTQPQGCTLNADFTTATLTAPLLSIAGTGPVCSTIGGIMYRGNGVRPWRGRFIWSDACSSQIYSAAFDGAALIDEQTHAAQLRHAVTGATVNINNISMIAEDGHGELYILQANRGPTSGGTIYRIVAAGQQPPIADTGQQGGIPGADGSFDNNDFVVFIDWFFSNDPRADMGAQGGLRGVDQALDNNDFVAFIDAFFTGT
ncbi:MAG TPA: PQQ-dependent sugar dehydrogenase [Phycisphaerales bacterium]|nr:PQQ-dependent sugar dehydrogenase [Phycisphaerales bacterium]